MKKYVILAGAPRSGKSTLAGLLCKKYGYQHISMDSVLAAIENVFKETNIDTNNETIDNTKFISSKLGLFIKQMINSGEYAEQDYGVVIDVCQLLPEDFAKNISTDNCDIYYFGTSNITKEERLKLLREFDTKKDYTYYESDDDMLKKCEYIVNLSNYIKLSCSNYGIRYFDTTYDRQSIFNNFLNNFPYRFKLEDIKTPQDILMYMNDNFKYGWLDNNNEQHIGNLKEFRRLYRTSTIEETLKYKIGTCLEQTFLMHILLDRLNIKNKMFCTRIYEGENFNNLDEEEHMHAFLLYYLDGKVYNLEHPNWEKMGIREYNSEEEAIKIINKYYVDMAKGKSRPVTQFFDVPANLSFKEFNLYINSFDEYLKKSLC